MTNTGVLVCLEYLELRNCKLLLWGIPILVHIKNSIAMECYLELKFPHHGEHGLWTQYGGVQEEVPDDQGQ